MSDEDWRAQVTCAQQHMHKLLMIAQNNTHPLAVHQVELVVQAGEDLGDGGAIADHAHSALHLGQVATCSMNCQVEDR